MDQRSAISKINKFGALLVFPIKNNKEPDSLWSQFFPRQKMEWEWSDDGDTRVGDLWHLMKRLSDCRQVIYSKWYQGRATFFSEKLFTALLCSFRQRSTRSLSAKAKEILETLEMDSPLSTRLVKAQTKLSGKYNEGIYNRAMKELFSQFLIVGFGEIDDGAFPSLAVGATRSIYEKVWQNAQKMKPDEGAEIIDHYLPSGTKFRNYLEKVKTKSLAPEGPPDEDLTL